MPRSPRRSNREPTQYVILTVIEGRDRSGISSSVKPLERRHCSTPARAGPAVHSEFSFTIVVAFHAICATSLEQVERISEGQLIKGGASVRTQAVLRRCPRRRLLEFRKPAASARPAGTLTLFDAFEILSGSNLVRKSGVTMSASNSPPSNLDQADPGSRREAEIVDDVIRRRRTWKILTDPAQMNSVRAQHTLSPAQLHRHEELVASAIATAGYAPFHYDRRCEGVAEPWRFHWLRQAACRSLAIRLPDLAVNMKPGNKLPAMLAACGSLVLITWLPEENPDDSEKLRLVNDEHLAATSAATQNLLLALESRGFGTYWSSGGSLRDERVYQLLEIELRERLIAAVFIDDPSLRTPGTFESIPGKNHEKRSTAEGWCRTIRELP